MKSSCARSPVSTLVSALFALMLVGQGVSSLAQTKSRSYGEKTVFIVSKIDDAVTREFKEAWHLSRNGCVGFEGLVLVYPMHDGSISARSTGKSEEQMHFSFRWAANIIAVVHTKTPTALIQNLQATICG